MKITRRDLYRLIRESFLFEAGNTLNLTGVTSKVWNKGYLITIPDEQVFFDETDMIFKAVSQSGEVGTVKHIVVIPNPNNSKTPQQIKIQYYDGTYFKITDPNETASVLSDIKDKIISEYDGYHPPQQTPTTSTTSATSATSNKWATTWDAYVKATTDSGDLVRDGWAELAESNKLPAGYDGSYKSWQKWYKAVNQPQLRADMGRTGQHLYPADILAMYDTFKSDENDAKEVQEEIKKELEIPQGKSINQSTIVITAEPMQAVYKTPRWKKAINWVKQKKADHEAKITARREKRAAKKQDK